MGRMRRNAPQRIGKKMKQFGIDKKKISKTLRYALAIAVSASMMAGICACNENSEASVPDSTTIQTTVTPTPAETTRTNETSETIVYIYGGRYYTAGSAQIEGKSGLTSMTLSEAQQAGYTSGATMTQDEKTAYDYNLAWNMVAEGKSDEEIIDALINNGYSNEYSAQFMVAWVREDWDMGIRAYEEPQNTPTIPSSNEDNSGSGSTTEPTGSTYVPSDVTPIPTEPTSTTQSTQPTTAPTSAPTETTQPTSAPTEPTSAPTETQATQPTSAPTETTPAPTETEKTIISYSLTGDGYDANDECHTQTFNGPTFANVEDQFFTWCNNNGYTPGGYGCSVTYSDGTTGRM